MFFKKKSNKSKKNVSKEISIENNTYNDLSEDYSSSISTIDGCFKHYFNIIGMTLANSQYGKEPITPELFAVMLTELEFFEFYFDQEFQDEKNQIIKWFLEPFASSMTKNQFSDLTLLIDKRRDFYRNLWKEGRLLGNFMSGNVNTDSNWPPYRYSVIFCDCIYNPACMNDYINSPVKITGIFDVINQSDFWKALLKYFHEYEENLKKIFYKNT